MTLSISPPFRRCGPRKIPVMPRRTADLMIVLASMVAATAARASDPPPVFVDKGACPFECCTYRTWTVTRDTALFDSVNGKRMVGLARRGMRVQGITGEVHTVPLKAKLTSGKEVWMLTYLGEGAWKTWDNWLVKESEHLVGSDQAAKRGDRLDQSGAELRQHGCLRMRCATAATARHAAGL